jgi:hypothetical protein
VITPWIGADSPARHLAPDGEEIERVIEVLHSRRSPRRAD